MSNTDRIDVHAHYLGGEVAQFLASGFQPAGGYQINLRWTPETALAFMDRHQIERQILSAPFSFGAEPDPGFARKFCRSVNEEYAELIDRHPGRFGAFAAVPCDSADSALAEIDYALDELRLNGVLLTSNAQGRYFGDPFYEPILSELDRRGATVFVHPTDSPVIRELGMGRPSSVIEFPFDTARNIVNAVYTGVFRRYANLPIIVAHCGGPLPSLGWRVAEHTAMGVGPTDADVTPAEVDAVLRTLWYETALAASRNSLLPTLEVTDATHILFGTDWPAAPETTIGHNNDNLARFGFSDEQLHAIEGENARRLLGV